MILCLKWVLLRCKLGTVKNYIAVGTTILDYEKCEDTLYNAWLLLYDILEDGSLDLIIKMDMKRCVPVIDSA